MPDHCLFRNHPTFLLRRHIAKSIHDLRNIHPRSVKRKWINAINRNAKLTTQQFHQGRIKNRIVVKTHHPYAISYRTSLKSNRHKQDRRTISALVILPKIPFQETQRKEKRVDARLLQVKLSKPVQFLQPFLRFRRRQLSP